MHLRTTEQKNTTLPNYKRLDLIFSITINAAKSWLTKSFTKGHEECGVGSRLNYRSPSTTQPTHRNNKEGERRLSWPPGVT